MDLPRLVPVLPDQEAGIANPGHQYPARSRYGHLVICARVPQERMRAAEGIVARDLTVRADGGRRRRLRPRLIQGVEVAAAVVEATLCFPGAKAGFAIMDRSYLRGAFGSDGPKFSASERRM